MYASSAVYLLAALGVASLSRRLFHGLQLLHHFFLRRSTFSRYVADDNTSWALVTGASDGLGRGFAFELCARGVNVIIHGRNQEKLQTVKKALLKSFPERKVEIVIADAARYDNGKAIDAIVEKASTLPDNGRLRILVNNVGGANALIGKSICHALEDTTVDEVDVQINVNARFPARLTTALLPLLTAKKNEPTLVINMGSIAGEIALPYMVIYNAVKAFNHSFSRGLGEELRLQGYNVEVMGVISGPVDTAGAPAAETDAGNALQPREMAKTTLDKAGCGKPLMFSYWRHWAAMKGTEMVPQSVVSNKMREKWIASRKRH